MLPFDLTWLEPFQRRSFRERFDSSKRVLSNALSALSKSRVISVIWVNPYKARFFLADGTFVALDFECSPTADNFHCGMISSASYDRLLCEHLECTYHEASDALISSDFVLLVSGTTTQTSVLDSSHSGQLDQSDHNLYFVYFGRRHVGEGCEQLNALDPHVQVLPLGSSSRNQMTSHRDRKLSRGGQTFSVNPSRSDRLRLVMNSSQEIFAVWWTNLTTAEPVTTNQSFSDNGEDANQSSGNPGGSLLFHLNSSACVLNPLAALAPASGQQFILLSFSNTAACELFAVEWYRQKQHEIYYFVLATTIYLIDQDELVRLDSSSLCIPDKDCQLSPSVGAVSPRDDRLLVAMRNSRLYLINLRASVVASSTNKFSNGIVAISWHPTGCLFAVVDVTGKLFLLDLGLSALHLFQLNQSTSSLQKVLPYTILADFDGQPKGSYSSPILSWNPYEVRGGSNLDKVNVTTDLAQSSKVPKDNGTLVIAWAGLRGLALFRLMLPHPPTSSYLIRHWLSLASSGTVLSKRGKHRADIALSAAVAIVCALDFDIDGEQAVRCVSSTATALLRQRPMNAVIDALLDKCLACFCNPITPISEVTKLEFGPAISQILRRRAVHLLRHGKLENAFDVAANKLPKPASDLLADTFYAALERGELALAKAAYARARKQVACAVAAVEMPTMDLSGQQESEVDEAQVYSF